MPFRPFRKLAELIRERRRDPEPDPVAPPPVPSPVPPARPTWKERLLMDFLKSLFAAGPGAVKGYVNVNELWKSFGVSSFGGLVVLLLTLGLTAVSVNAAAIFSPPVAGLATILLGVILTQLHAITSGQHAIVQPAALVPTGEVIDPTSDRPTSAPVDQARASQPFQPPEVKIDEAAFHRP